MFRSFRPFENFSNNRSRRDDSFGPKIVKIRAILAIFRPFKDFYLDLGGGGGGLVITSLGYWWRKRRPFNDPKTIQNSPSSETDSNRSETI